MPGPADSDRRSRTDRRQLDRRKSDVPIVGDDRRSGVDRRLAQRRLEYDQAVEAARAALIRHGINSPQFATAADGSEQARQRLNEVAGPHISVRP